MGLSREQILAADDRPVTRIAVPEWGGEVFMRILPGDERWEFDVYCQRSLRQDPESTAQVVHLLALTLCDEQGRRLFTDDDVKALNAKSGPVLGRLFRTAMHLNTIGEAQVEAAKGNS